MRKMFFVAVAVAMLGIVAGCATKEAAKTEPAKVEPAAEPKPLTQYVDTPTGRWMVHDEARPAPTIITPGAECGSAPSDAVVLFDGTEDSMKANWTDTKGNPTKWVFRDGAMESVEKAGYIQSKQQFGSCQVHLEFATPSTVKGSGQGRGNSGVFLQGDFEIQVLDSYDNKTYPDGQCGALYGRFVPLVNACRKPGEWQSFDIIQDHVTLEGGTQWINAHAVTDFRPLPDKGPLQFQDHGNPVRFRNVWVRELKD